MSLRFSSVGAALAVAIVSSLAACSPADNGSSGSGGSASGGKANASGGQGTGGASGGQSNANGGSGTGGSSAKGGSSSSGGSATGGNASGGNNAKGGSSSSGGSGTAGSTSNDIPATFATVKLVFEGGGAIARCASAPCHAAGGMAPPGDNLELVDNAQLYSHLTTHVSKACGNKKVVNPGNPNDSALVQILKGPCGDTPRMPYGCTDATDSCIPADYIDAISRWIANGAPQN